MFDDAEAGHFISWMTVLVWQFDWNDGVFDRCKRTEAQDQVAVFMEPVPQSRQPCRRSRYSASYSRIVVRWRDYTCCQLMSCYSRGLGGMTACRSDDRKRFALIKWDGPSRRHSQKAITCGGE